MASCGGGATGVMMALQEDVRRYRGDLGRCEADLEEARSNVEKWHSLAAAAVVGAKAKAKTNAAEAADSVRWVRSSVDDLRKMVEKGKRIEGCIRRVVHLKDKEIGDLKSEFRRTKEELSRALTPCPERRLVLEPMMRAELEGLRKSLKAWTERAVELEENAKGVKLECSTVIGRTLVEKCRTLKVENEESGGVDETKMNDLEMKLGLEKMKGAEVRSQFEALHERMDGLLVEFERSNRQMSFLERQIRDTDVQISTLAG